MHPLILLCLDLYTERTAVTKRWSLIVLLCAYVALLFPFTMYLKNRPLLVKLGYMPEARVLRLVLGDYRNILAESAVVKVLFYFGTLTDPYRTNVIVTPEYGNMFKTMEQAVRLDPYNMDAYYFTQAAFTWELGHAADVNKMLDYGMKYRTWDYQLPFYAGFNAAYFLHDYASAAGYLKKAAELSGNPLFTTLAARYFYEAGQSRLGLVFLDAMEKGATDKKVKCVYQLRKKALLAVNYLEDSVGRFRETFKRLPVDLDELIARKVITAIPPDPYGGSFFLDPGGKVLTTSKFTFEGNKQNSNR